MLDTDLPNGRRGQTASLPLPLLRPTHGQLLSIVGSLSCCLNLRHEVDFKSFIHYFMIIPLPGGFM